MLDATWNLAHVDDESDLTELSSEEDTDLPIPSEREIQARAEPRRTNSNASATFTIPRKTTRPSTQEATQKSKARPKGKWPIPAVESHQTISYTASYLYGEFRSLIEAHDLDTLVAELINKGKIELNPEYQRGIVWSELKQSNFINSLYHRFHSPEIVFNIIYDPDTGSRLRTCMDGKQRLTSICNFFDGKIPLMPYLNGADAPGYARRKFWSKKNGSATRPLIPPHVMDNLETSSIACVEYSYLSPDLEREIFQRVQHGVPLTPSDRLPAINGPWADVVRELRNRMNTTDGFEGYLDWGKARGKDFQALAQIVYLTVNGTSPKKAYPSSQRIETFLNSTDGKPSSSKSLIVNTMDIFCRIAKTPGINEPLVTNLSPLEFVMAAFLIFQQRTSLTDRQLSVSICKMREHARRRTEDMKFSQPNFKVFSDFVLKNLPKLAPQLTTPKENEKSAAYTPYNRGESAVDRFKYNVNLDTKTDSAVTKSTIAHGEKLSGKRKRATNSDDEDDDWIMEAPAAKSREKKGSQSLATKVDPLSKVVNRQLDTESKARTIVKKTPKSFTRSPGIKTPIPKLTPSKIDGQVGRPSIRPTPSQASGSTLPQSRSPTVLSAMSESTPPLQASRPMPSRIRDPQIFRAKVSEGSRSIGQKAVDDGIPPSSSMSSPGGSLRYRSQSHQRQGQVHGRPKVGDDPSTTAVPCNVGTFPVTALPDVGMSSSSATIPLSPVIGNRHDTFGMAPGTRRVYVNQTRFRLEDH